MISIVGVEPANSFLKLKTSDEVDCYLNTLRELEPFEFQLLDESNQRVYQIHGRKYVKGEAHSFSSSGRNYDRYFEDQYLNEMLVALSDRVYTKGQKFRIVTGLPCEDYKRKGLKERLAKHLEGDYIVTTAGQDRHFTIDEVQVIIQPLGALLYYVYDQMGRTRKGREQVKTSKNLVIDIGYGTTDIVEVENMSPKRFMGAEIGMMSAMNYLEDYIKRDFSDINGLPRGLELNQEVQENNVITAGGRTYDISDQKDEAFERTAREIMKEVEKLGFNIKNYDKVLFVGGGTTALVQHLKAYIEGINAARLEEAQLANAIGFYTYGVIKGANKS